jgi:hypothetical protein
MLEAPIESTRREHAQQENARRRAEKVDRSKEECSDDAETEDDEDDFDDGDDGSESGSEQQGGDYADIWPQQDDYDLGPPYHRL